MKGKFVSALVGLGAAALLAVPGAASASTSHAAPAQHGWGPGGNSCSFRPVPWQLRGRDHWVQEGYGWNAQCVLVPIWGGGGGGWGGGGGGWGGHGNQHGHNGFGFGVKISL
jgi:hypothetical protein